MVNSGNSDFIDWILSAGVPSQALVLEAAGAICEGRGRHKAAIEVLKLTTEIEVDNLDVYQALARSYMALKRYDDAAIVLERYSYIILIHLKFSQRFFGVTPSPTPTRIFQHKRTFID